MVRILFLADHQKLLKLLAFFFFDKLLRFHDGDEQEALGQRAFKLLELCKPLLIRQLFYLKQVSFGGLRLIGVHLGRVSFLSAE